MKFRNGSIGTISYFANGPKDLPKEYLEIYRGGTTAILNDFREVRIIGSKKTMTRKLSFQDKGQVAMVRAFLMAVKNGERPPILFEEIYAVMLATFKAVESLHSGSVIHV